MGPNNGELTLWQTVLFQAVKDGLERAIHPDPPLELRVADDWIRRGNKDFRHVCSLAGLDPGFVHKAYVSGRIRLDLLLASETGNKRSRALDLVASGRIGGDRRSSNAAR